MKQVILVRHAKSSWKDMSLRDHDRPLNGRGKRDAPFMAQQLLEKMETADAIVASSAVRAQQTAKHFQLAFEDSLEEFITASDLYHASPEEILSVIQGVNNQYNRILVFGHNPGFTQMANLFSQAYIDNVPTCGIVSIDFSVTTWDKVNAQSGKLKTMIYPKMWLT